MNVKYAGQPEAVKDRGQGSATSENFYTDSHQCRLNADIISLNSAKQFKRLLL